jgi:hypothetical protein
MKPEDLLLYIILRKLVKFKFELNVKIGTLLDLLLLLLLPSAFTFMSVCLSVWKNLLRIAIPNFYVKISFISVVGRMFCSKNTTQNCTVSRSILLFAT